MSFPWVIVGITRLCSCFLREKSYCNLHKHFSLSPRFFLQKEYNIWKICSGELLEEWRLTASLEMMRTHSFLTVLLWSSVFYVVHMTPSQERTNKHSHSERITGLSENDGKTLHRTKRGWMWNQFFLLEEYTGPDTQYVGKVSLVFKGLFKGVASNTLGTFTPSPQLFCFLYSGGSNFSLCQSTPQITWGSMVVQRCDRNKEVQWKKKGNCSD